MTFDEWLESRYPSTGKNPWNLRPSFREQLREAWSARDKEVNELVKALCSAFTEVWSSCDRLTDAKRDIQAVLAKYEE